MTTSPSPHGTLALILFSIGIVLTVLLIILALLWVQRWRRERSREATMLSGQEFLKGGGRRGGRGAYAQVEEEWSADMEDGNLGFAGRGGERGDGGKDGGFEQARHTDVYR